MKSIKNMDLHEKSISELKRLQQICFPKTSLNKENLNKTNDQKLNLSFTRGISLPPGTNLKAKNRVFSGEKFDRYEEKAKNLENNFKKFAEKYKRSRLIQPQSEILNRTFSVDLRKNENSNNLKEITDFYNNFCTFSQKLKPLINNVKNQEILVRFDKNYKISENLLSEFKNIVQKLDFENSTQENFAKIQESLNFQMQVLIKLFEKQDEILSEKSLKIEENQCIGFYKEFNNLSLSENFLKMKEIMLKYRNLLIFTKIRKIYGKIHIENKIRALKKLRQKDYFYNKNQNIAKRNCLLKKLINSSIFSKQKEKLQALNIWKFYNSIKLCEFYDKNGNLFYPIIYQEILNILGKENSWLYFHEFIKKLLDSTGKGILHSEFIRFNQNSGKLIQVIENMGNLEEFEFSIPKNSVSLLSEFISRNNSKNYMEISNIFEDKRFNRKIDFPINFAKNTGKSTPHLTNLSMICYKIENIQNSNKNEIIGFLRIYKNAGKNMFGPNFKFICQNICEIILKIMSIFNKTLQNSYDFSEKLSNSQKLFSELEKMVNLQKLACKIVSQISLLPQNDADFIREECKKGIINLCNADTVNLYEFENLKICTDTENIEKCIKTKKLLEISKNDIINSKIINQKIFIPIFGENSEIIGILHIERNIIENNNWINEISMLDYISEIAKICLIKIKQNIMHQNEKIEINSKIIAQQKASSILRIYNYLNIKYAENMSLGLNLILSKDVIKYPKIKPNFIGIQKIFRIIQLMISTKFNFIRKGKENTELKEKSAKKIYICIFTAEKAKLQKYFCKFARNAKLQKYSGIYKQIENSQKIKIKNQIIRKILIKLINSEKNILLKYWEKYVNFASRISFQKLQIYAKFSIILSKIRTKILQNSFTQIMKFSMNIAAKQLKISQKLSKILQISYKTCLKHHFDIYYSKILQIRTKIQEKHNKIRNIYNILLKKNVFIKFCALNSWRFKPYEQVKKNLVEYQNLCMFHELSIEDLKLCNDIKSRELKLLENEYKNAEDIIGSPILCNLLFDIKQYIMKKLNIDECIFTILAPIPTASNTFGPYLILDSNQTNTHFEKNRKSSIIPFSTTTLKNTNNLTPLMSKTGTLTEIFKQVDLSTKFTIPSFNENDAILKSFNENNISLIEILENEDYKEALKIRKIENMKLGMVNYFKKNMLENSEIKGTIEIYRFDSEMKFSEVFFL